MSLLKDLTPQLAEFWVGGTPDCQSTDEGGMMVGMLGSVRRHGLKPLLFQGMSRRPSVGPSLYLFTYLSN